MIGCGFHLNPSRERQERETAEPYYRGVLVLRGEGKYREWNGREYRLFPGCCFQRIPGRRHTTTYLQTTDWAECFVMVDSEFCGVVAPTVNTRILADKPATVR